MADDFFSSSSVILNTRTQEKESPEHRQTIWTWMEASFSKDSFKWLAQTIDPVFDIHALYCRVLHLANKATWMSLAMEFKKIHHEVR